MPSVVIVTMICWESRLGMHALGCGIVWGLTCEKKMVAFDGFSWSYLCALCNLVIVGVSDNYEGQHGVDMHSAQITFGRLFPHVQTSQSRLTMRTLRITLLSSLTDTNVSNLSSSSFFIAPTCRHQSNHFSGSASHLRNPWCDVERNRSRRRERSIRVGNTTSEQLKPRSSRLNNGNHHRMGGILVYHSSAYYK